LHPCCLAVRENIPQNYDYFSYFVVTSSSTYWISPIKVIKNIPNFQTGRHSLPDWHLPSTNDSHMEYEIWDSHRGTDEDSPLLRYDAVMLGEWFTTFRDIVEAPSSLCLAVKE
jgi:hypothetical protein